MDSYFGQFDIILTPDPALTVSLCRLKTRPRILQFVSGAWADTVARSQPLLSGYARRIEAEAYRMADRVIFMDESYESLFKTEERRRALIPNGVNLDIFNPSKYNREKQRNRFEMSDKIVILAVGTLRKKIKGHEFFIGAIPSVVRNFPNAHFYLVGKGDQESLRSQSESLGIAGHLHLLGERMDIPELLSAGDVFVLPSESEGTPGALLEAMAMKLPCIATRVGNVPRVIRHELDGILIEPANSKQIADTIVHLLSNPDLAIKLADRARKRVEEHYNFRDTTQAYISLVESVLKET
jgi:glycosyltransferase involved in cell wall biosynthesis